MQYLDRTFYDQQSKPLNFLVNNRRKTRKLCLPFSPGLKDVAVHFYFVLLVDIICISGELPVLLVFFVSAKDFFFLLDNLFANSYR